MAFVLEKGKESGMAARRVVAALLVLSMAVTAPGLARPAGAQPLTPPPPAPGGTLSPAPSTDLTPARVSYVNGEVSFWRPGAEDWAPGRLNTPLAPGDVLYTGPGGTVEIQVGPRAFVRAGNGAQVGLDNQEPDFIQLRVTSGHAALDLRQLAAGATVELDTPNAAFTVERAGYYHVAVDQDTTTFRTHRGGSAAVTPAGAAATAIPANRQVVVTGTDPAVVALGPAPQLTEWDRWNSQRTDYLLQAASARYVSPATYGAEALDEHGTWRTEATYGAVWVPTGVAAGWAPYTTGRWIWDPRFGWTWLDDAPWGWAPYHYGRWVFIRNYWAWAPGPIVVRPAYAPALVVFLGGVTVSVGRPLCWAPLGWGEPVIPWWGRPGFVGVAWWGGWGGPRVVNNVVINRGATVNVTRITVYRNVHVTNAVVGVPADRFGHGRVDVTRISEADVHLLKPVHGALEAKPVPVSLLPATGAAIKPPAAVHARPVVATRPPLDPTPTLREHGLAGSPAASPRLVPAPRAAKAPAAEPRPRPATPPSPSTAPGVAAPAPRKPEDKKSGVSERAAPPAPAAPAPAPRQPREATGAERGKSQAAGRPSPPPPPPVSPKVTPPGAIGRHEAPPARTTPPAPAEQPRRVEPPRRAEQPERGEPPARGDRPERSDRR
jgi:hypothetical protein